jgi:carbonic anhydrase
MKRNTVKNRLSLLAAFLALTGVCFPADVHDVTVVNAETALATLKKGNVSYVASPVSSGKPTETARAESFKSQHPIAVVVTCSDSRTSPEIIFNQNLNRLFVVRTAGNVVDDIGLGSIEYAVEHLGVRLIVVMGHQNCGAVKATVAGGKVPAHISSIVNQIKPAVAEAKKEQGDLLANSIQCNALRMADRIKKDTSLKNLSNEIKVVPAVYSLETGRVHWLN